MSATPLVGHAVLDQVFAWRPSGPVRVGEFVGQARALAESLPPGAHLLNVCHDRYRFAVGFAAGLIVGKTSLQPSSVAPELLRSLREQYPDLVCLCEPEFDSLDLPRLEFREVGARPLAEVPLIPDDRPAACLFTSGSTGVPLPHFKTWGRLALNGRAEAERLGLFARAHSIVGTVPVQHSYGFESTLLLALHGGSQFWSGRPFYPQDVADALARVPRPRLLVTTPLHLSALLAADVETPPLDMILSATAPLSADLAAQAEARLAAPLYEIYGATESGQVASRRTTAGPAWQPLPGVRLEQEGERTIACGGHVEGRVPLSDAIELLADGRFLLHGRHADMVNIAGKRTSFLYLNQQAAGIPGVVDAAFYLPDPPAPGGVARLCAFVVAPGKSRDALLAALRERIDSAFLPRPLVLVDRLPRNSLGKLPRDELRALYSETVIRGRR
jgi:acyl-coenzyme A synthetase/AMP-(fatty) acid ligase